MCQTDILDEQRHARTAHREEGHHGGKARRPYRHGRLGLKEQRRNQAQDAIAHEHPKRDDVDVHFATVLGGHRHLDGEEDRAAQRNGIADVELDAIKRHQANARQTEQRGAQVVTSELFAA